MKSKLEAMTKEEAKSTLQLIRISSSEIRILLYEMYIRKGYIALGYSTMSEFIKTKLKGILSKSYATRQLQAAKFEALLLPEMPIGTIKESILRPLGSLKTDELIKKAWEIATGYKRKKGRKHPTGKQVLKAVELVKCGINEETNENSPGDTDSSTSTRKPKVIWDSRVEQYLELIVYKEFDDFELREMAILIFEKISTEDSLV